MLQFAVVEHLAADLVVKERNFKISKETLGHSSRCVLFLSYCDGRKKLMRYNELGMKIL